MRVTFKRMFITVAFSHFIFRCGTSWLLTRVSKEINNIMREGSRELSHVSMILDDHSKELTQNRGCLKNWLKLKVSESSVSRLVPRVFTTGIFA